MIAFFMGAVHRKAPKVIGVIPARYQSSRFPGKVLAPILGVSLVQRTYENMKRAKQLDELVIATDEQKVFDHAQSFGAKVFMTSPSCESGSARASAVIEEHYPNCEIVVNIQADEPCLRPEIIDILIEDLRADPIAVMSTPVTAITKREQLFNPSLPKCVFDLHKHALYFSRHPIPYPHQETPLENYYRHIGVYAFRKEYLLRFATLEPTPLRRIEDLEQLRVLEHGGKIRISIVEYEGVEVNHPQDIEKVEEFLCKQNTSLSQAALSPR